MFVSFPLMTIFLGLWLGTEANTFANPIAMSAADPWLLYYKGFYYMTDTTGDNSIRMRKSKTLDGLRSADHHLIYTLNGHNMWAPEFHLVNGRWYLYYTAGASNDLGSQRIHVAESDRDDPMGPYHFKVCLFKPEVTSNHIIMTLRPI